MPPVLVPSLNFRRIAFQIPLIHALLPNRRRPPCVDLIALVGLLVLVLKASDGFCFRPCPLEALKCVPSIANR